MTMIRQDKFLPSQALYAIDLSSLLRTEVGKVERTGQPLYKYTLSCVWFKRRHGYDTSNIGYLWDITTEICSPHVLDLVPEFIISRAFQDGSCGATCRSRWDGERLWSDPATKHDQQVIDLRLLENMLVNYPDIPSGYDGWWKYEPLRRA